MVKCQDCRQEMSGPNAATTCLHPTITIDGQTYKRNTRNHDVNKRCHDCNIVNGKVHHYGCDVERCPKCKGQMIACGCTEGTPNVASPSGLPSFQGPSLMSGGPMNVLQKFGIKPPRNGGMFR